MKTKTKTKAPKTKAVKATEQQQIDDIKFQLWQLQERVFMRLEILERGGFFKRLLNKLKSHG